MLPRARPSFVGLFALLAAALLPAMARATTAPVILSLSYDQTFPSQYIGTTLTVDAVAIQPIQQVSVTPLTYTAGSVTLSGVFTGLGISAGTPLFVTDGTRTWEFTTQPAGTSVTLSHAALLSTLGVGDTGYIPLSWKVSSSENLFNETYLAYVGTLVTGATSGAQFTVAVGQFAQVALNDSGSAGDNAADDGIWTGTFTVPNNGTVVTEANFFASCEVDGTAATNQDFQSQQTASFDMDLPAIVTYSQSTTKSNYDGDLYLSSLCQGKSAANPADVQPSSAQAQFNFTVNKPNTVVNVSIGSSADWTMAATKQLPTYVFPNNAPSLNGWVDWVGDDGNQDFCQDGVYTVYYYVSDTDGLVGETVTTQIKVVSLKMDISNITLTPPSIGTQPSQSNGVITDIHYDVDLVNDSGTVLNNSLKVLGWSDAGGIGINQATDAESTVWTMQNVGTLDGSGTLTPLPWSSTDEADDDLTIANYFTSPGNGSGGYVAPALFLTAAYGAIQPYLAPAVAPPADGLITSPYAAPDCNLASASAIDGGDGSDTDDWRIKGMTQMVATGGSSAAPTDISAYDRGGNLGVGYEWTGATPAQANYRIDISSQLTGLGYTVSDAPTSANAPSPCSPTGSDVYYQRTYHFWPQSEPELRGFPTQGDLIAVQNTSAIFEVNNTSNPSGDNTPPSYVSSNPTQNGVVQPDVYSASNPLSVQFQDLTTAFNTSGSTSYITLTGPNDSTVGGTSSTNGGSTGASGNGLIVYFYPSAPLTTGGNYIMKAFTCNTNGLCVEQDINFTVKDTATPEIQSGGVVLYDTGGDSYTLNLCSGGSAGPYQNISQVQVSIAMPPTSTNTIDWSGCSVSLYQVSGTAKVPVGAQLIASSEGTSSGSLTYRISPTLGSAGLYEVDTLVESEDASGDLYTGPAALGGGCTNDPQFTVEDCQTCVPRDYSDGALGIFGETPITITSVALGTTMTTAVVLPVVPASLPAVSGYAFLTGTGTSDSALGFEMNASGSALSTALQWNYPAATPVDFYLYYNLATLTSTAGASAADDLKMLGYNGSSWSVIAGVSFPSSPTAGTNTVSFLAPNGTPADVYYALAYPVSLTTTPVPTAGGTVVAATPISFPNTRAFDPWSSNALYQKARFYYGGVKPSMLHVRVYDTAGRLIRDMSLSSGINVQSTSDPTYGTTEYYFTWDGTNDSGTVVHNGIYLVRWTETGVDGSSNSRTLPVALIK